MEMCVKARQSHRHREMVNPASVPGRDEITVNSSFPCIIHSHGAAGTASWLAMKGHCVAPVLRVTSLAVFLLSSVSHTLSSPSEVAPGGPAQGISLLFQDKSPCEVSADRCLLFPCVHLTYYSSAQHSGYHLYGSADNAVSLVEPLSDTLAWAGP